jgi:hypothetical protein
LLFNFFFKSSAFFHQNRTLFLFRFFVQVSVVLKFGSNLSFLTVLHTMGVRRSTIFPSSWSSLLQICCAEPSDTLWKSIFFSSVFIVSWE